MLRRRAKASSPGFHVCGSELSILCWRFWGCEITHRRIFLNRRVNETQSGPEPGYFLC